MSAYTEEQLKRLKETATVAVEQGNGEQNYWARVALQLIEELEYQNWRLEGLEK